MLDMSIQPPARPSLLVTCVSRAFDYVRTGHRISDGRPSRDTLHPRQSWYSGSTTSQNLETQVPQDFCSSTVLLLSPLPVADHCSIPDRRLSDITW